ncbi:hypothetical protein FRC03_002765 [Tulasnella sp. 419]|nr:hypothetical protein FRC03_002765 [Tulasnella sp. 419]
MRNEQKQNMLQIAGLGRTTIRIPDTNLRVLLNPSKLGTWGSLEAFVPAELWRGLAKKGLRQSSCKGLYLKGHGIIETPTQAPTGERHLLFGPGQSVIHSTSGDKRYARPGMRTELHRFVLINNVLSPPNRKRRWKTSSDYQQVLAATLESLRQLRQYLLHQSASGPDTPLVNSLSALERNLQDLCPWESDGGLCFLFASSVKGDIDQLRAQLHNCYRATIIMDLIPPENRNELEIEDIDFVLIDVGFVPIRLVPLFIPLSNTRRRRALVQLQEQIEEQLPQLESYGLQRHHTRTNLLEPIIAWDPQSCCGDDEENSIAKIFQILKNPKPAERFSHIHSAGTLLCLTKLLLELQMDVESKAVLIGDIYEWMVQIRCRDIQGSTPEALHDLTTFICWLYEQAIAHARLNHAHNILNHVAEIRHMFKEHGQSEQLRKLALSLKDLAEYLTQLERLEVGLKPWQEAIEVYRQLAEMDRFMYLPGLASHTEGLASYLSRFEQYHDSAEVGEQAVRMYRELVARDERSYLHHLGRSWQTLATYLSDAGRQEDALKASQEAVKIHRTLVRNHAERFHPALAQSLNQLCCSLGNVNQHLEAVRAAEELVNIHQELAKSKPKLHKPLLADSLGQLATCLNNSQRYDEAMKIENEAIKIREELVRSIGDSYLNSLNNSRDNLVKYKQQKDTLPIFRRYLAYAKRIFYPNVTRSVPENNRR